ncbi:MAG: hypothetical protein GX927_05015 [Lentisphaerae bacterium]|nr:hypothetical protein [Lentisphaerota bacterium]
MIMIKRIGLILLLSFALYGSHATWTPGMTKQDLPDAFAVASSDASYVRIEFNRRRIDFSKPVRICVDASQATGWALCSGGDAATPLQFREADGLFEAFLPQDDSCYGVRLANRGLRKVTLDYTRSIAKPPIDMAPIMSEPKGEPHEVSVVCQQKDKLLILDTGRLTATFDISAGLRLKQLFCADMNRQILEYPKQTELFRLKLDNETILNSSTAAIYSIKTNERGFIAQLSFPIGIVATLECFRSGDEIAFSLKLTSDHEIAVKTAFPQIDGLLLNEDGNDYYCFPWGGGVIGDAPAYLRSIYGENDAWWQMMDLFSPANGGGFFLRVQDATGLAKGLSMRKGRTPPQENIIRPPRVAARNNLSLYFYQFRLQDGNGSGIAVDYQRSTLAPGKTFVLPVTLIGSHSGNWKAPMNTYANWAKSVWTFRPYPGKLSQKFNYLAGFGCEGELYTGHVWDREGFEAKNDICEINGWWSVSPLAPWNTPWEQFEQLGAAAQQDMKSSFGYGIDPFSRKPFYVFCRGDYDSYNPQWGGLPRFRRQLKEVRDKGKISLLYMDPVIVCGNSRYGKTEAPSYAVINPDWKDPHQCPKNPTVPENVVCNYYSYCMCLNTSGYLEKIAEDVKRVIEETGADGIRLDEYGHRGYVCLSKNHKHIFGEHGQHVWLQALEHSLKLIREVIPQDTLLVSEFPQADFAASRLDASLSYDICRRQSPLRPLQINLFRFYFPECRLFELNVGGPQNAKDIMLFNGNGVFNSGGRYSKEYTKIVHENAKCFVGEIEPLVTTLRKFVYANRFSSIDGNKILYSLYNGTGQTISGPVLEVPAGYSYRQLLPAASKTQPEKPMDGNAHIVLNSNQIGIILMERLSTR